MSEGVPLQDGGAPRERVGSVGLRRRLLGAQLGIGECNGKQLLRVLNRYSFSRAEVEAALHAVNAAQPDSA